MSNAAAAAAYFTSLAILPMMLTVASFLRAVRPILGPDASLGGKQGFANLLRIVLTARGSSAADAARRLVTGSSHSLLTIGSLVSLLVLTRAFRCVLDGLGDMSAPSDAPPGDGATAAGCGPSCSPLSQWSAAAWLSRSSPSARCSAMPVAWPPERAA